MESDSDTYDTQFLVNRVYTELKKMDTGSSKLKLVPPDVIFQNQKTYIKNMKQIRLKLQRDESDLLKYFEEELRAKITIDQNGTFVITGRFQPNNIKNVLANYIKAYVLCEQCKGQDTSMVREKRRNYLVCNSCHSKKVV
jgi:translation initiation factor 2 beta subunit (eIF-2beta)/eIF-5